MSQAKFGIAITADDKTAKGVASAEKRLGQIPRHASIVNKRSSDDMQRHVSRAGGGILKTFGRIEQASARALGGRSVTSGLVTRLGAVSEASAAAGESLGQMAIKGGIVAATFGPVGIVAAATAAVIIGVASATDKMVSGWAKGVAGSAQFAASIGVTTKALQEFQGAGERLGIDKNASGATLANLSKTLNDARYGRNSNAVALLSRMGVQLQTNADGTVDTAAMLTPLANAMQRQNASGARVAGDILGIDPATLAIFRQGGAALSADMADTDRVGAVATAGQVAKAMKYRRSRAIAGQLVDRAELAGGELLVDGAQPVLDKGVDAGRAVASGQVARASADFAGAVTRSFTPAAEKIDRAGGVMQRAATSLAGSLVGRADAALASPSPVVVHSKRSVVAAIRRAATETGMDPEGMLRIAHHESGLNPSIYTGQSAGYAYGKVGTATGLFQFVEQTWMQMIKNHGAMHGLGKTAAAIRRGRHGLTTGNRAYDRQILDARTDPYLNAIMAAEMMKDAAPGLTAATGHAPGAGDYYMNHFLGAAGSRKFFRLKSANPNASAAASFPAEARANRADFFDKRGQPRSFEQLYDRMTGFANQPLNIKIDVVAPSGTKVKGHATHNSKVAISHSSVGN